MINYVIILIINNSKEQSGNADSSIYTAFTIIPAIYFSDHCFTSPKKKLNYEL